MAPNTAAKWVTENKQTLVTKERYCPAPTIEDYVRMAAAPLLSLSLFSSSKRDHLNRML